MKQKGFTLIELLVVVAIIGILAAVGVTTFSGFQEKAKISTSKANHQTVVKKLNILIQECQMSENGKVKLMLKINDKTKYEKGCWYDVKFSAGFFKQNSLLTFFRHLFCGHFLWPFFVNIL